MKKILLVLLILLFPISVKAMAVSEKFNVGDSVTVDLIAGGEAKGFHVLRASAAGEQTVTLIYDGVIAGSATVYDEENPVTEHEATVVYDQSIVSTVLNQTINKEGALWRVEHAGLLTASDLTYLGITPNASGIYEIPAKYSFLAPIKLTGLDAEQYNYWTSIANTNSTNAAVYCVEYNDARTTEDGVWATLASKDITSITNNTKCAVRPVVVIDKQYILCNNSNPKTGVTDYIIPLVLICAMACGTVVLTNKKRVFKKI